MVMKRNAPALLLSLFIAQMAGAQSLVIPEFKSPQNQCDYLIVTPAKFLQGAENLAQFRQSFSGYKTGIVLLDSLYAEFDSVGRRPFEKVWWGLKYAFSSWNVPPKMVVLMGADSLSFHFSDSTWSNCGDMPAAVYQWYFPNQDSGVQPKVFFEYSDDYYAALSDSAPCDLYFPHVDTGYPVVIGRIPCDSSRQCVRYVQKVIDFETGKRLNKSWFNSAMVVSDDTMRSFTVDPLGFMHLEAAEECADSLLGPWFITKIIGCAYSRDSLTLNKPQVEDSIVNAINRGNLWSIYIGHAGPDVWSDEQMLLGKDAARFHNDSMPSVFVSFSCMNADYIDSYEYSMCKQFLFASHGGALAYIAATVDSYSSNNADLMRAFFNSFSENQQQPLGLSLCTAKLICADHNSRYYAFLGDPALTLSGGQIHVSMTPNNQGLISFACQSSNGGPASGNFDVRIYKREKVRIGAKDFYYLDSLVSRQTGTFTNGDFAIAPSETGVRVVAYVWNENGEGRMDSSFLVQSIPVTVHADKLPGAVALKIENGKVFIRTASLHGTTIRLAAFTMNGKVVISREFAVNSQDLRIDTRSMGLAAGTYLVRLTTVKGVLIQRMILAK
jgi:hypothetical protein